MSRRLTVLVLTFIALLFSFVVLSWFFHRPLAQTLAKSRLLPNPDLINPGGNQPQPQSRRLSRISLQAPALNLAQRLGTRFVSARGGRSIFDGSLIVGADSRNVRIERRQGEAKGEEVEVSLDGPGGPQNWTGHSGAMAPVNRGPAAERELIERLVADSPDQFVLAQLRGASYSTIGRNVRAGNSSEGYQGPLWEIIRVDEPQPDNAGNSERAWRLYYLNQRTGLIDRVVSQSHSETIETQFLDWTNYNDELVPTRITWTGGGRTIMEFRLTQFLHAEQ